MREKREIPNSASSNTSTIWSAGKFPFSAIAPRNVSTGASAAHVTHTGRGLLGKVTLNRHIPVSSEEDERKGEEGVDGLTSAGGGGVGFLYTVKGERGEIEGWGEGEGYPGTLGLGGGTIRPGGSDPCATGGRARKEGSRGGGVASRGESASRGGSGAAARGGVASRGESVSRGGMGAGARCGISRACVGDAAARVGFGGGEMLRGTLLSESLGGGWGEPSSSEGEGEAWE